VLSNLQLLKLSLVGVLSCHVLPCSVNQDSRKSEMLSEMLLPGQLLHAKAGMLHDCYCRMACSQPATRARRSHLARRRSCTPGGAMRTTTWPATSSRTPTNFTCMPWLALGSPGRCPICPRTARRQHHLSCLYRRPSCSSSSRVLSWRGLRRCYRSSCWRLSRV
jgi:hypothetical protein